ncbi:MAG TPA: hypothetical protein VN706_11215 [Gemmatimonadaceae bacterium]|nr:hypothetical protein [Gemmatimonadaceae bacterium]
MTEWQPYREPIRVTLLRTLSIALVAGAIVSMSTGGLKRWPILTVLMLWPSFGGHWIDLFFLNVLRSQLPARRAAQRLARVAVWFVGGVILAAGVQLTARLLFERPRLAWLTWATAGAAGAAFVAIELVAHAALHLRGRASFYDGHG